MKQALCLIALGLLLTTPDLTAAKKIKGTFTLQAKLLEIPGKLPPDDLYDYAYVMKYQVVGGERDKEILYVAHYKPRQPRDKLTGKMKKVVGGSLKRFTEGELHQLTLAPKIKKVWRGAVVDEYFATDRKSPRYFCLKADPAKKK